MIDGDNLASLARRRRDEAWFSMRFDADALDFATWHSSTLAHVVKSIDADACRVDRVETVERWQCSSYAGRRLNLGFSNGEKTQAFLLLPHRQMPGPALLML